MKPSLDLTLYLVTDSGILASAKSNRTLAQTVEEAIHGGVTVVQLREKQAATSEFVRLAVAVKEVTKRMGVALLINDRIDVALAVDADGVHIGQDDMPLAEARRLLGDDKIIGVTVQTREEAEAAVAGGADYLGIGTCYATATKRDARVAQRGPQGIRSIWEHSLNAGHSTGGRRVRAVTIGGINAHNTVHVLTCTRSLPSNVPLDGIAVVSAIMASDSPRDAACLLRRQIEFGLHGSWVARQRELDSDVRGPEEVRSAVARVFERARTPPASTAVVPLVQHITNTVVINDCANACLALGGSPIMASDPSEQRDLAPAVSSVVVNIGTISSGQMSAIRESMREARLHNTPIVLDPVGVGATASRRDFVSELLRDYGAHVIKGNAGEIAALVGSAEMRMRGVDAVGVGFEDPARVVRDLSRRERCVVVMTGKVDYVSDGCSVYAVHNGHRLQGSITGSGCMVGTAVATFIHSVAHDDPLAGALVGVVAINLAAEAAASRDDVKGPGTFRAAFIDEMHNLTVDRFARGMRIERL
ncbi:thiamine biosynthetic bifunctional enzyme [Coemansia sp. Benny D160-2]|nr:thiamine biosynthetic bifunctional enzyme [Coemansia sp. Benny D160-2]